MNHSTGSATGVADLLDKIKAFMEAQGWTSDAYTTEGTGKRLHLHKGGDYVNFRSFINEARPANVNTSSGGGSNFYGILANLSSGYSGAASWFAQSGAYQRSDTLVYTAGGYQFLTGSIPSYHFFADSTSKSIYLFIEGAAGEYQWIIFGNLTNRSTYTGGRFFSGSYQGYNTTKAVYSIISGFNSGPVSFIDADFDSEAGWKAGFASSISGAAGKRRVIDSLSGMRTLLYQGPNQIGARTLPLPLSAYIFRDTNNSFTTSPMTKLGDFKDLYFVNLKNLIPGDTYSISTDDYIVLPFYQKSDTYPWASTAVSGYLGLAIKKG